MQRHVTIALPPGISVTGSRNTLEAIEAAARQALNDDTLEAGLTDLAPFTDQERRVICAVFDLAQEAQQYARRYGVVSDLDAEVLADLRARIAPDDHVAEHSEGLTRQQECAADAMASEYGRSRVRHLADGAVVIVGMTDDIERRSVCVERDGRERWRA